MKPLEGVRVVDFTRLLPGPLATQWLAGLGAHVIKIEDKGHGDYSKYMGHIRHKVSIPYALLNFHKELHFKDPENEADRKFLIEQIKSADVLIESFRPDTMKKWGLDYQSILKINPKIVYCSLTGFGQSGSMKDKAGHDINYLALSGVLDQTGPIDSPALSNFQIADIAGGSLPAVIGITSALYYQQKTQRGSFIDCSILDNTFALNPILLSHFNQNNSPKRSCDLLTGAHPGYSVYQCSDGRFMALGALENKFWNQFCDAISESDLKKQIESPANWPVIKEKLSKIFMNKSFKEWCKIGEKGDYCLTPVLTYSEACQSNLVTDRNLLVKQMHPTEKELVLFQIPLKFNY